MLGSCRQCSALVVFFTLALIIASSVHAFGPPTSVSLSNRHRRATRSRSAISTASMTAQDIDGKSIAAAVRAELTEKLSSLPDGSSKPGLAVMLVGERKDSQVGSRVYRL